MSKSSIIAARGKNPEKKAGPGEEKTSCLVGDLRKLK